MKERSVATSVILTVLTCGIYGIYWFVVMTDEVKAAAKDTQIATGGTAFLLTLITCGIYGIYWAYKMGELIGKAQSDRGMFVKQNGVLYLVLQILGLGIVNYILIQGDLNEIVRKDMGVA